MPPSSRSSSFSVRYGVAVAAGALALLVNMWTPKMVPTLGPTFLFGGTLVLVVFIRFGFGPGLVAGVLALATRLISFDILGTATAVYMLEAVAAALLYPRLRSLILSVLVFWFAVGWWLDLWIYGRIMGLDHGYVALVFLKQIFNGVINAAVADFLLGVPFPAPFQGSSARWSLRGFFFGRVFTLITLPLAMAATTLVRVQYERSLADQRSALVQAGVSVTEAVEAYVGGNVTVMRRLANMVSVDRVSGDTARATSRINNFRLAQASFYNLALTQADGTVTYMSPTVDALGQPLAGGNVGARPYFGEVRAQLATVVSPVILGRLHVRHTKSEEPVLIIASPVLDRDNEFGGVVFGALDVFDLGRVIPPLARDAVGITVVDRDGGIIYSTYSMRSPGSPLRDFIPEDQWRSGDTGVISFVPRDRVGLGASLGLDLDVASIHETTTGDLTVVAETSLIDLRNGLLPRTLRNIAIAVGFLVLIYLSSGPISRGLARPLKEVGDILVHVGEDRPAPEAALRRLRSEPIEEVAVLADHLSEMEARLHLAKLQREEAATRRMESLGSLAAGVAHGLNNRLTPILAAAETAKEHLPSDDSSQEDLARIVESAKAAQALVAQLTALGWRQFLRLAPMDLNTEVEILIRRLQTKLPGPGKLSLDLDPELPPVLADGAQVALVLDALVANAGEAMEGEGTVTIITRIASVGPGDEPGVVRLSVMDDGRGMSAEVLDHCFDPFFTTKRSTESVGLGLSTVQAVMLRLGGWVEVSSAPGAGARVDLFFRSTDGQAGA